MGFFFNFAYFKVHYFATGEFLKNFGMKNYRDIVQKKEIAEAVELLGCWYIDKKRDFSKGIEMWIWALMIRGDGKIFTFFKFFFM